MFASPLPLRALAFASAVPIGAALFAGGRPAAFFWGLKGGVVVALATPLLVLALHAVVGVPISGGLIGPLLLLLMKLLLVMLLLPMTSQMDILLLQVQLFRV